MSNKQRSDRQKLRDSVASDKPVTRKEFVDVLEQMTNNLNELTRYLTSDVNVMFQRYVYPILMKQEAIIELLTEKGILTRDEIMSRADKLTQEALASAQQVDEEGNLIGVDLANGDDQTGHYSNVLADQDSNGEEEK